MRAMGFEAYPGSHPSLHDVKDIDVRKKSEPLNLDSGNGTMKSSKNNLRSGQASNGTLNRVLSG